MELVFATNNQGKLHEIKTMAGDAFTFLTLKDIGIEASIAEPFLTFRENARAKAEYVYEHKGLACFAEDSGLVVPALNGEPGVHSARYGGDHDDEKNNQTLIKNLQGIDDRKAWYQATICLFLQPDSVHYFEGRCLGSIAYKAAGTNGFGYDPYFIPQGFSQTFGVLSETVKNELSHRAQAFTQLVAFLKHLSR